MWNMRSLRQGPVKQPPPCQLRPAKGKTRLQTSRSNSNAVELAMVIRQATNKLVVMSFLVQGYNEYIWFWGSRVQGANISLHKIGESTVFPMLLWGTLFEVNMCHIVGLIVPAHSVQPSNSFCCRVMGTYQLRRPTIYTYTTQSYPATTISVARLLYAKMSLMAMGHCGPWKWVK